ncbi:MAG: hypothetical protein Q8Q60_02610 [Candidatus Chromulinivorax sp.]|nr:hypothetical protein [Candidatus Chromulinivorax sp.]
MIEHKDQLIDIYDVWYKPFWQHEWFAIIAIMALCAVVGVLLYYLYRKYIQKKIIEDCAIIAYRDLDELKNFHIATKQDSKDCYFSLSSIIKSYLASRYHTVFTQLTDKEIVRQAESYMTGDNVQLLQQILHGMVLLKFEHAVAANKKLEKDIELIEEFIQNTTSQHDTKEI